LETSRRLVRRWANSISWREAGAGDPHQSRLTVQHDAPGDQRHAWAELRREITLASRAM